MKKKEAMLYTNKRKVNLETRLADDKKIKSCDHKVEGEYFVDPLNNSNSSGVKCKICGEIFSLEEKDLRQPIRDIQDALNCIKLLGSTCNSDELPKEVIEQIANIMVFLDKLPKIYKRFFLDKLHPQEEYDEDLNTIVGNGFVIGSKNERRRGNMMIEDLYYKKHHNKNKKNKDKDKKKKKKYSSDLYDFIG